ALRRDHDVRFVGIDDLTYAPDNRVLGLTVRPPSGAAATTAALAAALAAPDAVRQEEDVSRFDVVFLRYNPSREARNGAPPGGPTTNPGGSLGGRLRLGGTLVVNDPAGIQRAGGRMYLSPFPREIRPRTLIPRSDEAVKRFLRELDGPAIIKPLAAGGVENV